MLCLTIVYRGRRVMKGFTLNGIKYFVEKKMSRGIIGNNKKSPDVLGHSSLLKLPLSSADDKV